MCVNCERLHKIFDGAPPEKGEIHEHVGCNSCKKTGGIHFVTKRVSLMTGHVWELHYIECSLCAYKSVAIIKPNGGDVARTMDRDLN